MQAEREAFEQEKQMFFQEIEHLKRNWEEERPNRVQEAYDEGFGQGYEDGTNKANEAMMQSSKRPMRLSSMQRKMQGNILRIKKKSY